MSWSPRQIEAACAWWAKAIECPKFDNGDKSEAGGMTTVLATMLAARHEAAPENVERFKAALATRLAPNEKGWQPFCLSVDYGPCRELADAADAAGISYSRFPYKTVMWAGDDGSLTVRHGYGAPIQTVLAPETLAGQTREVGRGA